MIIQLAGTNGSGKSTVVRQLMEKADQVTELEESDRVVGYRVRLVNVSRSVRIVGHYDCGSGGADTIKNGWGGLRERVLAWQKIGVHVLFEGASHTMNQTRGPQLLAAVDGPFVVILLTTPVGVCLRSIQERRALRGTQRKFIDTKHVRGNHLRAQNYTARMRDAGARVVRASREEAVDAIMDLLRN